MLALFPKPGFSDFLLKYLLRTEEREGILWESEGVSGHVAHSQKFLLLKVNVIFVFGFKWACVYFNIKHI